MQGATMSEAPNSSTVYLTTNVDIAWQQFSLLLRCEFLNQAARARRTEQNYK